MLTRVVFSRIPDSEVSSFLEKVLKSEAFAQAGRLREFLRFVVEQALAGESAALKETVIGVAVFGREPGYDPKSDNIVRTVARRVRAKLDEYYAQEGREDPIRIELPKGSYVPLWAAVPQQSKMERRQLEARKLAVRSVPDAMPAVVRQPSRLYIWLGLALLAGAAIWVSYVRTRSPAEGPWHSVPFTSSTGYQMYPAISPDGRLVAFSWGGSENGPPHLYVQAVRSQTASRVTSGNAEEIRPAWAPDGKRIAFVRISDGVPSAVFDVPANGGPEHKIGDIAGRDPERCNRPGLSWSPDGKKLALVEPTTSTHACGIILMDVSSGRKQPLTVPANDAVVDGEPHYSPDGQWIAFLRQTSTAGSDVFVIRPTGGEPRRVTFDDVPTWGLSWFADGKALVVASRRDGAFLNLWRVSLNGYTVRMTESPLPLGLPSVSAAGDRIAYVVLRDDPNIWRFANASNQLLIESRERELSPRYSPNGKQIAFCSDRAGNLDLWVANADGRQPVRLTDLSRSTAGSPAWSPDGRRIAFDAVSQGQTDIYVTDAQPGGKPLRLTNWHSNEILPSWSRDGRFVYFGSNHAGTWNVYRVAANGGEPVQITRTGGFRALESLDGDFLYYTKKTPVNGVWRMPLQGDTKDELVLPDFPSRHFADWALGPGGLYYLSRAVEEGQPAAILLLNLKHEAVSRIGKTAKPPTTDGFSISPDGKAFLYVQLDESGSSILLLEH